ncbi:hypothetical protein P7K49_016194 [Saguinus oedipus]|uniref:Uncharacterized protein n=1 Tax=Saguinus oedipus TaxID=9490 RepID=A0ABQ9VC71_SAGOE|nr:hypothetical protein P7K49_016194 [Saguinus oedipus]
MSGGLLWVLRPAWPGAGLGVGVGSPAIVRGSSALVGLLPSPSSSACSHTQKPPSWQLEGSFLFQGEKKGKDIFGRKVPCCSLGIPGDRMDYGISQRKPKAARHPHPPPPHPRASTPSHNAVRLSHPAPAG